MGGGPGMDDEGLCIAYVGHVRHQLERRDELACMCALCECAWDRQTDLQADDRLTCRRADTRGRGGETRTSSVSAALDAKRQDGSEGVLPEIPVFARTCVTTDAFRGRRWA